MNRIIAELTKEQLKEGRDHFKVGDAVAVHVKVREGDKERTQVFSGIVISLHGAGVQTTFTVRRVTGDEGVERVFPLHSPNVEKVEVMRKSQPTRARRYDLRKCVGKRASKVKEVV